MRIPQISNEILELLKADGDVPEAGIAAAAGAAPAVAGGQRAASACSIAGWSAPARLASLIGPTSL